jgi:cell division septation protein DedD
VKNKDYREIQLTSSQLVFIFLGILILGVVVFLLGVSVGEKKAQIVRESELPAQVKLDQAKDKEISPSTKPKDAIDKELASHQKVSAKTQKKSPKAGKTELFYIQVAAFNKREPASAFAEEFEKKGYPALVLEPFPSDRRTVFRVRIGGYETREKAEEINNRLKSESKKKKDYFIIKN